MEKFSLKRRVYYYETDKMGRVYHSNFVNWMEEARTEFIRTTGVSYKQMEEGGLFLPISEIGVKYYQPVEYDEYINIVLNMEEISRVKIKFLYEFWNEKMSVKFADSFSVNVFTDNNGKVIRVSDSIIEKMKKTIINYGGEKID